MLHFEELAKGIFVLKTPLDPIWSGVFLIKGDENVLIDSSVSANYIDELIIPALDEIGVQPSDVKWLINTHSHGDHTNGNIHLMEVTGAKLAAFEEVAVKLRDPMPYSQKTRGTYPEYSPKPPAYIAPMEPDLVLKEGDVLAGRLKIYHTPGHDSECISILDLETNSLLVGDSLQFQGTTENGGFELAFYKDLVGYRKTIEKMKALKPVNIFASHEYVPAGFAFWGREQVDHCLKVCEDAVEMFGNYVEELMDEGLTETADIARGLIRKIGAHESAYLFSSMFTVDGHIAEIKAKREA